MNVRHYDQMFETTRSRGVAHTRLEGGAIRTPINFLPMGPSSSSRSRRRHPLNTTSTTSFLPTSSHRSKSGSPRIGIASSGSSPSIGDSIVLLAITGGRGEARAEIGMAAIDPRLPHLILCQISDCQTYASALAKIYVFDPAQVLMPTTMCDRSAGMNEFYRLIREKFPVLPVTAISRIHFNKSTGLERVRSLCATDYSSVELFLKEKYYALAAAAALLKYVEYVQRIPYVPKSMKIEFQGPQNATTIDMESARNLELVTSQSGQKDGSLLATLNRCSTPMGRKLLRASILQPPCKEREILDRQACITELLTNRSLRALIQPVVRRLYGAEKLLCLPAQLVRNNNVQSAQKNLNYILLLKNSLDAIPELRAVLASGKNSFFRRVCQNLDNEEFRVMRDNILRVVHPDARRLVGYMPSNLQRCFAVKPKVNDMLDVARQTYCELIDDMKHLVERLASKYKLVLSLRSSASMGYHIRADFPRNANVQCSDLPTEFIEVRKNRSSFVMMTKTLMVLGQQCKRASEEVQLTSSLLLCDLVKSTREHVSCLFQLSADVAELDLIVSLAETSSTAEYTRPTFGPRLKLEESTHPIMESLGLDRPVENDVRATVPFNFNLITGPNMSGKSTYLKQIVLLQIMAQIGCYVPAKRAEFRIADHIFCKMGYRDEIECNASTFVLEMKEVQYILDTVTASSLVILDELCGCTTVEEGASLAWSICERLLITSAFTFVATHFFHLTKLPDVYPNVTNYLFETTAGNDSANLPELNRHRLTYTYRLKRGSAPADDYGIALAELTMPKSVTDLARKYALEQSHDPMIIRRSGPAETAVSWDRTCYDFVAEAYDLIEADRFDVENIRGLAERFNGTGSWTATFAKESETTSTGKVVTLPSQSKDQLPADLFASSAKAPETFARNCAFEMTELSLPNSEFRGVGSTDDESEGSTIFAGYPTRGFSLTPLTPFTQSTQSTRHTHSAISSIRDSVNERNDQDKAWLSPMLTNPTITSADFSEPTSWTKSVHYEHCLSDEVFLPSGTSSSWPASSLDSLNYLDRVTAREKEARIFRQIEGSVTDEAKYCNAAQVPMNVDLSDNATELIRS